MDRLNKVIARSGYCSRRKADELIKEGKVKVDGVIVNDLGIKISSSREVEIDGTILTKEELKYYVMYKPRGIICSVKDELGRKTVIDLLPDELKKERIFPVGRLDYDTKGVLLLTNDGNFMNNLVGPKSGIEKEYLVRVEGILKKADFEPFEKGMIINGKKTLPSIAKIESVDRIHNSTLVRVILTQGMYHQVKEMFKNINHPVKKLTRVRFGQITLDNMSEGSIRKLSIHEVKTLFSLAKKDKILNTKKEKYRHYS